MPFYAVARGKVPGVYETWAECKAQTESFGGARFKKFSSREEAKDFVDAIRDGDQTTCSSSSRAAEAKSASAAPLKKKGDGVVSVSIRELHTLRVAVGKIQESCKRFMEEKEKELEEVGGQIESLVKRAIKADDEVEAEAPSAKKAKTWDTAKLVGDGFAVSDDGFVEVYTDGACLANGIKGTFRAESRTRCENLSVKPFLVCNLLRPLRWKLPFSGRDISEGRRRRLPSKHSLVHVPRTHAVTGAATTRMEKDPFLRSSHPSCERRRVVHRERGVREGRVRWLALPI